MKRVIKWIFVCLLIIGVVATFAFLWSRQQPKPEQYEVLRVERRDLSSHAIVTGKVEPRDEVAVKAQLSGIIAELYKEPGQRVKVGEPIARIKVVPEMTQLANAESRVRLAEHSLKNVQQVYARDSALFAQNVISREEFDNSSLKLLQAQEELKAAKDNLSIVQEGVTAGEKGNTIVRATIAGMVLDVPVKVGNTVINANTYNDGTTIATIADMSDMLFVGKIDETDVGKLHEGMKMDLIVGALNDQRFEARLEYISPKGTESNGAMMFEIKGAATIPDTVKLRSGYSANAQIILESRTQVLTLDEAAVHITPDSTYVLLAADSTAQEVTPTLIETGMSDGIYIEITSGLSEGDLVRGNTKTIVPPAR
ncbi:MAG: efflux RND transporter periplasmic adaptor subunit [Paludibacteraceae bacterium]|nr:efflux RND transporter periplasmic adaptor subunit [Paludibacteraceae bacterium]